MPRLCPFKVLTNSQVEVLHTWGKSNTVSVIKLTASLQGTLQFLGAWVTSLCSKKFKEILGNPNACKNSSDSSTVDCYYRIMEC